MSAGGGVIFGTTEHGGLHGYGGIFKLVIKTGVVTLEYSFTGGTDGAYPRDSSLYRVQSTAPSGVPRLEAATTHPLLAMALYSSS